MGRLVQPMSNAEYEKLSPFGKWWVRHGALVLLCGLAGVMAVLIVTAR